MSKMSTEETVRKAVDEIHAAKKKYDALLSKIGKNTLRALFNDAFADHPELAGVVWTQFVAEYDDNFYSGGDEINELHALIPEGVAEGFKVAEGRRAFEFGTIRYRAVPVSDLEEHMPAITNHLRKIADDLVALKPCLKEALGDSSMVTVTRAGFESSFTEEQHIYDPE